MAEDKQGTPASIWLVAIGILVAGIGWMVAYGSSQSGASNADLGSGLTAFGGLIFGLGLLIEFFSIGSSLRRIAGSIPSGPSRAINNDMPGQEGPAADAGRVSNPITRFWDGK